jgi:hypothetical protein
MEKKARRARREVVRDEKKHGAMALEVGGAALRQAQALRLEAEGRRKKKRGRGETARRRAKSYWALDTKH